MSAKVDMGLKVVFILFFLWGFSLWFLIVFALTSLVVLASLVFPMAFVVFTLLHCMFKRVPENN